MWIFELNPQFPTIQILHFAAQLDLLDINLVEYDGPQFHPDLYVSTGSWRHQQQQRHRDGGEVEKTDIFYGFYCWRWESEWWNFHNVGIPPPNNNNFSRNPSRTRRMAGPKIHRQRREKTEGPRFRVHLTTEGLAPVVRRHRLPRWHIPLQLAVHPLRGEVRVARSGPHFRSVHGPHPVGRRSALLPLSAHAILAGLLFHRNKSKKIEKNRNFLKIWN